MHAVLWVVAGFILKNFFGIDIEKYKARIWWAVIIIGIIILLIIAGIILIGLKVFGVI
jgi:hypothetical protein